MAISGGGNRQQDLAVKLVSLKKRLEEQKSQRHQLQGEYNSLTRQMLQEYGINNVEDAERHIEKLNREIEKMEKDIRKCIRQIEEKMEGNER